MAESILVTGKKISSMELVTNVTGNEKIPTGQPNDLAVTPNQIADHTIARGDLVSQEDLSQVEVSLGTQIADLESVVTSNDNSVRGLIAEEAARIAADNDLRAAIDSGDASLQSSLDAEVESRIAADNDLRAAIDSGDASLQSSLDAEVESRIAADNLKVDKEGSVSSVAGRVGAVVLTPSDVLVEGFGSQEEVNKYVPKPFLSGYPYDLAERVVLSSGEVVKSLVDGNVGDPNVDMSGWVLENSDSAIITWSGRTQEDKNRDAVTVEDYGATGSTQRLSTKYASLTAAQVDYPSALTLNDTFDIVAFEKALANNRTVYGCDKTYYFNRELRIPSYRGLYGKGIRQSFIKMTNDAFVWNNIITNEGNRKQGNKNSTNTSNECIFIDGWTLDGNAANIKGNTVSTAESNPLGIASSSGLGKSGLVFSGVYGSSIKNIEITQASGHCLDIAARHNATEGSFIWSDLPSRNINIDNIILSYNQDDALTTHFSENINISNFLIYHSGVFTNSNGIEVDDGSRFINISNGFIFNQTKGISIKSHDNAPAPFMVNVSNVTAVQCNNNFNVECGAHTTLGDNSPSAYGVNFVNCVSWLARARVNTTRTPRHVYVGSYSGVQFTNLQCYGDANTTLPRPTLDDFDYGRPYQPEGYGTGTGYNQVVIEEGEDVTYKKMLNAIYISDNSRNVKFTNLLIDGVYSKTAHIYVRPATNNVTLNSVTIKDSEMSLVDGLGLVYVGGSVKNLTINDLTALNTGATISAYPVFRSTVQVGGLPNLELNDIKAEGYAYYSRYSASDPNPFRYKSTQEGYFTTILTSGQTSYVSNRAAGVTGAHIELKQGGGTTNAVFPASAHAEFLGAYNAALRIGSSSDETLANAYYWEVGTKTSGSSFFPSVSNAMSLGKASNLVSVVYAGTGTINTSDERLKQQFQSLSEREKEAALEIKNSIQLFKFNDAVDLKGDGARWHCGVKAQQVISILESHDLDPFEYAFMCFDEWEATGEHEAGSRYAIRYDELSMFMLAAM